MKHPDADSYYRATARAQPQRPPIAGDVVADVAVIGAGYTGLSAALHLAGCGLRVVVLEAESVGFGASGRNGGQVSTGQRRPQDEIECLFGRDAAMALWRLAEEAKALVKSLIREHRIDCELQPGVIEAAHKARHVDALRDYPDYLARHYGYDHLQFLEGEAFQAHLNSPDYLAGTIDGDAAHLHPLHYAHGLAAAAEAAGAVICEASRVSKVNQGKRIELKCDSGLLRADHAVFACNGYLDDLHPALAARIMPLNNFIIATEPLGRRAAELIPSDAAVADTRNVINYFRMSRDGRLLFGGGETYSFAFPGDIKSFVRPYMTEIFPDLRNVGIDFGWGGTLAITRLRLPCLMRLTQNSFAACGYSGHGVSIATLAGQLIAEAVAGQAERFDVMARIAPQPFPGGTALRLPLLWLAMLWYRLKDRL